MNCLVRSKNWLPQTSDAKFRIFLTVLFLNLELFQPAASCKNQNCSQLNKNLKFTMYLNKKTAQLLEIYKDSQGDSTDLICEMQMDNVPVSTIHGQSISERILSIYMRLKEFLPHLKMVMEQQNDLELVSKELNSLVIHVHRSALMLNCLFQTLQPNIPVPEPAEQPTGIPPAQNIFQQKAYGCIVLTRLQDLFSEAVREQKSLRGQMCRKKRQKT